MREAVLDYFGGEVEALKRIPWTTGGTAFQRRVWAALTEIPAGRTETYGQLAARIGAPTAVRAVGLANGANPVGVIVPCHRVVGSSGKLTGYAGGLERKKWLLEHEGALKPDAPNSFALVGFALAPGHGGAGGSTHGGAHRTGHDRAGDGAGGGALLHGGAAGGQTGQAGGQDQNLSETTHGYSPA